jgi:hypothetical protein
MAGSALQLMLDPGQRERGFRKRRVKEAELQFRLASMSEPDDSGKADPQPKDPKTDRQRWRGRGEVNT